MKVWINRRTAGYSGGLLLVAANSAKEAHELCVNSKKMECIYWIDYMSKNRDKTPIDDCYKLDGWEEIPNLWYAGVNPCIIAEEGYTE